MATSELKVQIDAAINAAPTLKALEELKKLQQEVVVGSEDFKKIEKRVGEIGDAARSAQIDSRGWLDVLSSAPGPLGSLATGLKDITTSTNKFGLALKATGIGLVVALLGQLVAAFTSNEKAMKKLEPIMIAFEQILGGIFTALEPILDMFIELAMQVLPYLTQGIGIFYSILFGLFTLIKDVGVGAGKLLAGIFTLDMDLINEGMDQLKGSITSGVNAGLAAYDRFEEGTKEVTETQKKNLEEMAEAHAKYLEGMKASYEAEEKLRQANLDNARAIAMAQVETEQERFDIEVKFAQDSYNSKKKLLEETQALYSEDSKEYNDYIVQLIALDTEYITKKAEFTKKEQELVEKSFQEQVKAQQTASRLRLDELNNQFNLVRALEGENAENTRRLQDEIFQQQQRALESERQLYESKKELSEQDQLRILEIIQAEKNLTTAIEIENNKRLLYEQDLEKKRLDEARAALEVEKQLEAEKVMAKLATLDNIIAIAGAESAVGRAALIGKQIILAKELLLQAKSTLGFATLKSTEATVATTTGAAKTASAGFPQNVPLLIAYAAQAAGIVSSIVSAVRGAKSVASGIGGLSGVGGGETPPPSGGISVPRPRGLADGGLVVGPGGGQSDLIPAMLSNGESVINANSTAMFKPLLSAINSIGGGRRFAEGGLALSNFSQNQAMSQITDFMPQQPIKTYVVSSDMTNQQMFDREIKSRSTI